MIAVFAYDFPHRKTQDFLIELALSGERDVLVLAAPWRPLPGGGGRNPIAHRLQPVPALPTDAISARLGFRHERVDHSDIGRIAELVAEHDAALGIVAGARILKRGVIEAFRGGVVNFHPGKIPETSGLDSFFYSIRKGVPLGVTAHFIDHRVDAGAHLFFEELPLGADDDPDVVQENLHRCQIRALRRFLALRSQGSLASEPIDRPHKNEPMSDEMRRAALEGFPAWRAEIFLRQQKARLLAACASGDEGTAASVLERLPQLLEARSPEGWTPLIVAAFNQHVGVVRLLLALGADPCAAANKGTTVLMYAKTAVAEGRTEDVSVLEALMAAGARADAADVFGKTVFDYLAGPGAERVAKALGQGD